MIRNAIPWITAVLIIAADRISKLAILDRLSEGDWLPLMPGVALTHVHNTGIAFSMFSDGGPLSRILLHGVIVTAVVLIAWMVFRHGQHRILAGLAFGLILGGAIGNLIDRVLYGWVIDFLHIWIRIGGRSYSWPDFNVADSAITVGAALLILGELRGQRDQGDAPDAD